MERETASSPPAEARADDPSHPPAASALVFAPASVDQHLDLLHGWLQTEHVGPWWGLLGPVEQTREYLEANRELPYLRSWVVADAAGPFAYVETYIAADDPLGRHYDAEPGDRGWHVLIGPEQRLGGGIGRRLAVAVLSGLLAEAGTTRVVCEPDVRNERMLRFCAGLGAEELDRFPFGAKTAALLAWPREVVAARWPEALEQARAAGRRWDRMA